MLLSTRRSTRGTRRFLKCERCRNLKRKCIPEDRDWDAGEKCHGCTVAGHPCGPNQHHAQQLLPPRSYPPSYPPSILGPAVSQDVTFTADSKWTEPRVVTRESTMSPPLSSVAGDALDETQESYDQDRVIHKRLQQLGSVSNLYDYLRTRRRTLVESRPREMGSKHDQLNDGITDIMRSALSEFVHLCKQVMNKVSYLRGTGRELYLLRLESQLDYFLALYLKDDQPVGAAGAEYDDMREIHMEVMRYLVQIYDELNDYPESFCWRRRMQRLSISFQHQQDHADANAVKAFQRLSDQVWQAFNSIKISSSSASLFKGRDNFFPATHFAGAAGHRKVAHELAKQNLAHDDILERLSIHRAAECRDHDLLIQALDHDPSLLEARDLLKFTPLCIAAYVGDVETVSLLCRAGSSLEAYDYLGRDCLIIAAEAGNYGATRALLERGADVSSEHAPAPYSALHAAARGGHTEVVKLLLEHGASPGRSCDGKLPADDAWDHGHRELARLIDRSEVLPSHPKSLCPRYLPESSAPWSADEATHCISPIRSQQRKRARVPSRESSWTARRWPVVPDRNDDDSHASEHQLNADHSPSPRVSHASPESLPTLPTVDNDPSKETGWVIIGPA